MNAFMRLTITVVNAGAAQLKAVQNQVNGIANAGAKADKAMGFWSRRSADIEKFGKNLQWTGRQLEYRFTLPIIAAGAMAFKFANDNEKALTRIRKVYGDLSMSTEQVNKDVNSLGRGFRVLSDLMGINQSEVIEMGALWAQAGAQGAAMAQSVRLTAEAQILGSLDSKKAAESLIAIQTQYSLSTTQLKDALAALNIIENETAIGFDGLIESMVRGASTARTAGIDIRHYAALTAALVPAAGTAAQAGNALKTIISRLMAPTRQSSALFQELGLQIDTSTWQSKNGAERLMELAQAYKDLTGPQQIVAASIVGSRFQVSKFSELMRALADDTSQYARALLASSDAERNSAVYKKELGIFLSSQPQAFKIFTTQLKNLMAEVITPLMPMLLHILRSLVGFVRWFTNLSPTIQKATMMGLLFLALLGPLLAYLGSFIILGAQVIKAWRLMGGAIKHTATITKAVSGTLVELSKGLLHYADIALDAMIRAYRGMATAATRFWAWIVNLDIIGWTKRHVVAAWGWTTVRAKSIAGSVAAVAIDVARWVASRTVELAGWAAKIAIQVAGWAASVAVAAAGSIAVFLASGGWIVLLIAAVVAGMIIFRKPIWAALKWVAEAFGKLPGAIVAALRAVVRVVREAALAVYEWLSYLNPFAQHSPSLVEQVIRGVDIISRKYKSLTGLSVSFRQAAADFRSFTTATAGARGREDDRQFTAKRSDIVALDPGVGHVVDALWASIKSLKADLVLVGAEFLRQEEVVAAWEAALADAELELEVAVDRLDDLRAAADAAADALTDAKDVLNALTNTPIDGMGAMSDAIFANEMAQKSLRLEILKMAEAGETVDDLRDRMSKLGGEIEMLRGDREDLRLAGAGSDVLGGFDAQIGQMEAARRAMASQAAAGGGGSLADQLAELQRQGEILDLENSLKFDPLRRQIDEVTNSLTEMPFDALLAKIIAQQDEVAALTTAWETADAAVKDQQGSVDDLTAARDAIATMYEIEKDRLDELGTSYDDIERQIGDMEGALDSMASSAKEASDSLDAFRDAGLGDFVDPGGLGDLASGGDIDALVAEWQRELDESFGKIDMFKGLKDAWNSTKEWFNERWQEFQRGWDRVLSWFSPDWDIWGSFKTTWSDTKKWFTDRWAEFQLGWDRVLNGIKGAVLGAFNGVKETVASIWNGIGGAIVNGINLGITAVNWLITGLNKVSDILPGINFHINPIGAASTPTGAGTAEGLGGLGGLGGIGRARGGLIPTNPAQTGPFRTSGVRAIVGEGNPSYPEFVIPTDPRFRGRSEGLFAALGRALGAPGFAAGGILPPNPFRGITDGIQGIFGAGADLTGAALAEVRKAAVTAAFAPFLKLADAAIGQIPWDIPRAWVNSMKNEVYNWVKGGARGMAGGGIQSAVTGGVLRKLGEGGRDEAVIPLPHGFDIGDMGKREIVVHATFPNVKDGSDAKDFLDNLESLAG